MNIRVLLADDHTLVRQALGALLATENDIEVVAEAGDGADVLRLAAEYAPDIVVMDVSMPKINGIEATKELLSSRPDTKVIALSAYADKRFVLGMLEAGATGYIVKAGAGDELLRAIRSVMNNQTFLCSEVSATLVEAAHGKAKGKESELGRREREVIKLLAEGLRSSEIATSLHIAPSTVEVHRRNIMRKLDMHSIAELTKYAIREGLTSV